MKESLILQFIEKNKNRCDWLGIRHIREETTWKSYRDGQPEKNSKTLSDGFLIEVIKQGHSGYVGTAQMTIAGLEKAFSMALFLSEQGGPKSIVHFDFNKIRPASSGDYQSKIEKNFQELDPLFINKYLKETQGALKVAKEVISSSSTIMLLEVTHQFYSSNGSHQKQHFFLTGSDMHAFSQSGKESQSRSNHGGLSLCYQSGTEIFNLEAAIETAKKIGNEAVELLTAQECPTGEMDLILLSDQMNLQIHESIGHPLEYDRILGDERNYAGWSFVKANDFGNYQYGSKLLNVTFDPSVQGQFASYQFDDVGQVAQKEFLIKDGILLRGLGGTESQFRLGLPGVANMRTASWNRAPIDRMANINLEVGHTSLEQMIKSVQKGVLMTSNKSWSIDDYRNKFQFGCEFGKLIENGKIVGTVKNPNYRSKTAEFWKKLDKVGDTSTLAHYGSPYCGKGEPSQIIRVGHRSPACLFKNIEIFGGH